MAHSAQDLVPNGVFGVVESDSIISAPREGLGHSLGFISTALNALRPPKQAESPIHANRDYSGEKVKACSSDWCSKVCEAGTDHFLCV